MLAREVRVIAPPHAFVWIRWIDITHAGLANTIWALCQFCFEVPSGEEFLDPFVSIAASVDAIYIAAGVLYPAQACSELLTLLERKF